MLCRTTQTGLAPRCVRQCGERKAPQLQHVKAFGICKCVNEVVFHENGNHTEWPNQRLDI